MALAFDRGRSLPLIHTVNYRGLLAEMADLEKQIQVRRERQREIEFILQVPKELQALDAEIDAVLEKKARPAVAGVSVAKAWGSDASQVYQKAQKAKTLVDEMPPCPEKDVADAALERLGRRLLVEVFEVPYP